MLVRVHLAVDGEGGHPDPAQHVSPAPQHDPSCRLAAMREMASARGGLVRDLPLFALAFAMVAGPACSSPAPRADAATVDAKDALSVWTWSTDAIVVRPALCGNGAVGSGESCDDGNTEDGDGCGGDCRVESGWLCRNAGRHCLLVSACGNGVQDPGEACDDGNTLGRDGCNSVCESELGWHCPTFGQPCTSMNACGNGLLSPGEACDDGNTVGGDGCSGDCTRVELGWRCRVAGKPCSEACGIDAGSCTDGGATGVCGNGTVEPGEECDFGTDVSKPSYNGDGSYGGCTSSCTWGDYCGDGIINGQEVCDDGPANGPLYGAPGCTFACTKASYCGDGIVDEGEACDLGPNNSGDCGAACSRHCDYSAIICH